MPGDSRRRGAVRKPGSKKGPTKGSGGKGRRSLEGRGPTPKAEDRTYHPAAKRKAAAERRAQAKPRTYNGQAGTSRGPGADRGSGGGRGPGADRESRAGQAGGRGGSAPGNRSAADSVIGRNAVVEALRARVPARRLDVAQGIDQDDRIREALKRAGDQDVPINQVTKRELDQRFGPAHQGIALRAAPYQYLAPPDLLHRADQAGAPALIVALDQVTDPHNLGAVIRSAAAFGAHGVLIPERRSAPMGPTAWKVSAGAAARVPVARAANLVAALEAYKKAGLFVIGLDASGAVDAAALDLATGPVVVVVGSEGKGLARLTRAACDLTAAIPIDGATESLNAAVAGGIVLYEVAKQRRARRTNP